MSSRAWQIAAAAVSVALMIFVLFKYGLRDDAPPKQGGETHAGASHHTAEQHEGGKPWPLQAYGDVNVGDWTAFETTEQLANARPKLTKTLITIEAVDDKAITYSKLERESSLEPPTTTRDTLPRHGLTIDMIAGNDAGEWTLYNLTTSDETHEVGGRAFACKKLTYSLIAPLDRRKRARVEMWASQDVPLDGVVELRQGFEGTNFTVTHRLVGFGTASAVTWGKKPEGL